MKALIDGDIVIHRSAFSAENEEAWVACARATAMIEEILVALDATVYEIWISGENNFRYQVFPEYKANRLKQKRPRWEQEVKQHLLENWGANISDGCEADDMLGSRMSENSIICTNDKDLKQIPGWHYNFVTGEKFHVSQDEADRYFFYQLIVGDTTDGIKGVVGSGPQKAKKVLSEGMTNEEMYDTVLNMYSCEEEFDLNAQCVYIWRKDKDHYSTICKGEGTSTTEVGP